MRLIDADELLKVTVKRNGIWNAITNSSGEGLEEIINNQPTIEISKWTPVTKATPKDGELVNITWINHNPEPYYEAIKDKPFTATAYYFKGAWYWFSSTTEDYLEEYGDCPWDRIDTDLEITAWMPLPQPYKEDKEESNANDS